jgi:alkylation response protein AidB-like acyl-CoA dehydrogenase
MQLTEEQTLLRESVDELLARETEGQLWESLVEFGALEIDPGDGLGAVELALVAERLGAHLAAVPYADSAAVHYAARGLDRVSASACLSEPTHAFDPHDPSTTVDDGLVSGEKSTVPFASVVELLAVPAASSSGTVLALVSASAAEIEAEPTLDPSLAPALVRFEGAAAVEIVPDPDAIETLAAIAGVLASAEAVGAAAAVLELAREYASQRRQFGHTIGSFQAVRHLLADMYVQVESSWSSVLYAAAALDEDESDSSRAASVAKAYAARATRDVAHGALQVFGGVAFTAEHPAHRFLRRIVARGGQYGSARDHERKLGRALAEAVGAAR